MTTPPPDPDLELVLLGYIDGLAPEQRERVQQAYDAGRVKFGIEPDGDGTLTCFLDITQRVLALDAAEYGYELDDRGNVIRR